MSRSASTGWTAPSTIVHESMARVDGFLCASRRPQPPSDALTGSGTIVKSSTTMQSTGWNERTPTARRGMSGRWTALALTMAVASCGAGRVEPTQASALSPGDHTLQLRHDGRRRSYIVHVPERGRGERPLMIAFHGGGGNASGFKAYAGIDAVADREGFIAVYPDGTGPLRGRLLTFNGGGCCGYAQDHDIDDVGFTIAVIDDLARRVPIDRKRIYATGHSNGAIMAWRLAAERADVIAAIVPVAGAMSLPSFAPARAVPVLDIHSIDDPRALYDGGLGPPFPGTRRRVMHAPVQHSLDSWLHVADCPPEPVIEETRRGRVGTAEASHTATKLVWHCANDVEIAHWKLTVAGHGWPGSARDGLPENLVGPHTTIIDAAEEAWAFASQFSLR
jgi:polyhydroxybutyrate depolymerase